MPSTVPCPNPNRSRLALALGALALLGVPLPGCQSEEAPRIAMPVAVDASAARKTVTSDLGYQVTLSTARAALADLRFTVGGETHASRLDRLLGWVLPTAHAHPGHAAGGEVVGELPGRLLVDFLAEGKTMGTAVLIAARYQGANFTFRTAQPDELPVGDSLTGHTFVLEGTASRDGRSVSFTAEVDVEATATVIGVPFDHEVTAGRSETLGLRLLPVDPTDGSGTIWNGIDFFGLGGAATGRIRIAAPEAAHNFLVRALRTHDRYDITSR